MTGSWRALVGSLRFKVAATVVVILAVAMGVVLAVQYRSFRREMLERLGLAAAPLSDVIKGSLRHAMLTRDLSGLAAIVDDVSRQPGVIKVVVLDKRGEIRVSPVGGEVGARVPRSDATCQICHGVAAENRAQTVVFTAPGGERTFRSVTPIANEPACHGCHDRRDVLNGVLISDFSMTAVEQRLAAESRQMLLGLLAALGATGLAITLIMNRLVVGKLERVVHATRLLGRGRLDLALPVGRMDEIGQLAASFNEMVHGLRQAKAVQQRLAAGVAHELNNPLGHVLMYAKLLLEALPPDTPAAANARHVVDNTVRCRAIVRSLLDYARQSDADVAPADLNEIASRSVALVAGELERRHIACELVLAPDLPPVPCDGRQIQQVLVNLLENGTQAIDDGDGRLTVFTGVAAAGDAVVVGVRDNGRGIAAEHRGRLFEPFYTTRAHGTGLGLAIAYGIVDRHHGRILLDTHVDGPARGSTFSVELPLAERSS